MKKDKGIRLHKEYGLNPTMPVCFFCGKEKGEIAFLGDRYDGEAPKHMCIDYEPCENCKAIMAKGVTVIEVSYESKDCRPPISKGDDGHLIYPTGRWLVATEQIRNLLSIKEDVKSLSVTKEVFDFLIKNGNPLEEETDAESEGTDSNT